MVLYDESKIASAILKAMEAAGEGDATDAANVANDVQSKLEKLPECLLRLSRCRIRWSGL